MSERGPVSYTTAGIRKANIKYHPTLAGLNVNFMLNFNFWPEEVFRFLEFQ